MNVFLVLIFLLSFNGHHTTPNETLQLVITFFRHGDRTPDSKAYYPTDPYNNETYYPYGFGQLTNLGKKRMYQLGRLYREKYDSFLGPLYIPGLLDSLSTDVDRTKNSLQLFVAGLFPPGKTELKWHEGFNWNPIPYKYVAMENNRILSNPVDYCHKFQLLFNAYKQTSKAKAVENRYSSYFPYISKETSLTVNSIVDLFPLYFALTFEKEWGLHLPNWTLPVYPDYLHNVVNDNYASSVATPQLNQLNGGFLLQKIMDDMNRVIDEFPNQPKIYVYCGHEMQIVALLGALNLYYLHAPYYGANVLIELHKMEQDYYVKVRYNGVSTFKFKDLTIPGCQAMCPYKTFVNLLQENLPGAGDPCRV